MAISYNDWKKSYEELDAAGKQKFVDLAKNSDIGKQYMQQYASEIGGSKNTGTTSTSSNTGSTSTNNNTSNTGTSTSTTGTTGTTGGTTGTTSTNNTPWYNQVKPEEVSTRTNANNTQVNDLAYQWNKLSYEQQQEKLKQTPALKQSLANLGITIKGPESATGTTGTSGGSAGTTGTTGTSGGTTGGKGGDEWDYQDNSQARMDEILKHLNKYRVTNPSLFSNYDDFYNFFIAGKGRSPEQIKVLNDYFKNTKAYNSYDNMSSSDIGYLMVHGGNGTVDDYVNLLKSTDPQRYAEIQAARKDEEDKIKSNSTLDTISDMMGEGDNETLWKNKVLNWMKENGMFVDKDGNLVDDRLENYASEEEKGYQKEIADLYADILDIDNTVKHTYEDLRDRYPGASKSTLMAMANDKNSDLLREREDKMVTITKLQGYVGYMQENRKEMNDAGKQTITNLQKQYGMYYEYSPEGIKERAKALAEAEYESTHVTLDQADNGTDTEKQMALQSVLDGYYQKYGDIIERSEQQVINDVMRLAKEKGISLSDALEENFLQYLRAKPGFKQLSTITSNPNVTRIGTDSEGNPVYGYYDEATGTFKSIYDNMYGDTGTGSNGMYNFSDYTPMSSSELEGKLNSFESDHPVNSKGGQCGAFVNDYLQSLGLGRLYTDPIDKKLAVTNSEVPVVGGIAVMSSEKYPQYGHTAIIKDIKQVQDGKTMVQLLESNRGDDEKVHTRRVNADKILGVFDPTKQINNNNASSVSYDPNMTGAYNQFLNDSVVSRQKDLAKQYGKTYDQFRAEAEAYAEDRDANAMKPIVDAIDYILSLDSLPSTWERAIASGEGSGAKYYKAVVDPSIAKWASKHNLIYNTVGMDKFLGLKSKGATFGALSEGEREAIYRAATDLDPTLGEDDYREALSNLREQIVANSHGMLNGYGASAQARQANYIADSLYGDLY